MSSIGQIAGPRFHEVDEVCSSFTISFVLPILLTLRSFRFQWFDKKKVYLDSLESQLRGLLKALEVVSKQRTGGVFLGI